MRKQTPGKLHNSLGLARIHVILLVLCLGVLLLALKPAYEAWQYHGEWLACASSLRVVNGALVVEYLNRGEAESLDKASEELVSILPGRDGFCPSGGTVYFLKQADGEWKAVCGMHDSDHSERTRLNASYVLRLVREAVRDAQRGGIPFPKRVTVELNGEPLTCELASREVGIRRGTDTTKGYSGTVVFYGLEGCGNFSGTGVAEGKVGYFCFANEEYSAVWRNRDGWTGSVYGDRY